MEPHSLVLLSGSTLDACHSRQPRRIPPVPGPRRPLRNFAQGLAKLFPQLKHFSRRFRRVGQPPSDTGSTVRTEVPSPSTSNPASDTVQLQASHHRATSWRAPRWHRLPRIRQHEPNRCQKVATQPAYDSQLLVATAEDQQVHQPEDEQPRAVALPTQDPHLLSAHRHAPAVPLRRGPLRRLGRVLRLLGSRMRPQGPGDNDKNLPERVLNVTTCGMFFQAGGKILRLCRSLAARRFGWAFIAVGAIATIYHGSWGRFRNLARKVDYYAIAVASMMLRSVVVAPAPRWLAAAMLTAMPFKPTLVSTSNFMAVEVRYMLLALSHRKLLGEWAAHAAMSATATACFTLEDTALLSWFPYTHAAFHALSSAAFLTLPSALNHLTSALPAAVAA